MPKKKAHTQEQHRKKALEDLTQLGHEVVEDIRNARPPKLKIPSRSTTNIIYDKKNRYFVLGPKFGIR